MRLVRGRWDDAGMTDSPQDAPAPLVGTVEAARAVGLDRSTITRWVHRGQLHPTKRTPGGQLRWDVDDLRRQLAELTETPY